MGAIDTANGRLSEAVVRECIAQPHVRDGLKSKDMQRQSAMETATNYGGPIDPFSPNSLHDVVEGDIPTCQEASQSDDEDISPAFEYEGLHILRVSEDRYRVTPDGHTGCVLSFGPDDYDDVLELVDDLNECVSLWREYNRADDTEGLVGWAGKIQTSHEEKAEERPDLYVHIPDEPVTAESHYNSEEEEAND